MNISVSLRGSLLKNIYIYIIFIFVLDSCTETHSKNEYKFKIITHKQRNIRPKPKLIHIPNNFNGAESVHWHLLKRKERVNIIDLLLDVVGVTSIRVSSMNIQTHFLTNVLSDSLTTSTWFRFTNSLKK